MIISASRRCDLPAHGHEAFRQWLRRGWVEVANPFRPSLHRRVSLERGEVDAFVFWTRNPAPFMDVVRRLEEEGYPFYFLITVTGYPATLEPRVPRLPEVRAFLAALHEVIGRGRIVWRYDPVFFTAGLDEAFHRANFRELATAAAPFAGRVIVSHLDLYRKTARRFRESGIVPAPDGAERYAGMLTFFAVEAAERGMEIRSCGETVAADSPVPAGRCIDEELLRRFCGVRLDVGQDRHQRPFCLCRQSVDIGAYATCPAGCLYCYAG